MGERPEPPPGLRERNRLRAREDIGRAARRLFLEEGYAQTSVERVAAAAGVSLRTVFRHFRQKEDLVFFEHDQDVQRLRDMLAAADPATDSLTCLLDAVRALYVRSPPDPDAPALMALMDGEPDLRRRAAELASDHERTIAEFLAARSGPTARDRRRALLLAGAAMGALGAARRLAYDRSAAGPAIHLDEARDLLAHLPFP